MDTILKGILFFFGLGDNPIEWKSKSDFQSIQSDWDNIGGDFQRALMKYGE